MRTALVAALLLLLAVPAATAQLSPTLDLQVKAPTTPVGPDGAEVLVTVTVVCSNPAMYVPDQVIRLEIRGPGTSIIDGPESVIFPARSCAFQSIDERLATYIVKLPADVGPSTAIQYSVQAEPANGDPLFGMPDSAEADFTLASPAAPPEPAPEPLVEGTNITKEDLADATQAAEKAAQDQEVMDVPAPSWLFAALGIGLAAFRRR
jgi:hypothetical protein